MILKTLNWLLLLMLGESGLVALTRAMGTLSTSGISPVGGPAVQSSGIAGEAVIFFDPSLAEDFGYRCKQAGQLASKMRFLAAPWVGMLESGAWLRNAAHGNACARRFSVASASAAPPVARGR